MADKVVRLEGVHAINAQANTGEGKVYLQMTGRADGREVRVELALESHDVAAAVHSLRGAVKVHRDRWVETATDLGEP